MRGQQQARNYSGSNCEVYGQCGYGVALASGRPSQLRAGKGTNRSSSNQLLKALSSFAGRSRRSIPNYYISKRCLCQCLAVRSERPVRIFPRIRLSRQQCAQVAGPEARGHDDTVLEGFAAWQPAALSGWTSSSSRPSRSTSAHSSHSRALCSSDRSRYCPSVRPSRKGSVGNRSSSPNACITSTRTRSTAARASSTVRGGTCVAAWRRSGTRSSSRRRSVGLICLITAATCSTLTGKANTDPAMAFSPIRRYSGLAPRFLCEPLTSILPRQGAWGKHPPGQSLVDSARVHRLTCPPPHFLLPFPPA